MAKQVIPIGVAVSVCGDGRKRPDGSPPTGLIPGFGSAIINIAAAVGDTYTFNENITPDSGVYGETPFWTKHPDEFAVLKRNPVPLDAAMTKFRAWLRQFQGTLVACSSSFDFWHLVHAFFSTGKDFPFGTLHWDTHTLKGEREGKTRPSAASDVATPLAVAKARWLLRTAGAMPEFGAQPARRPRRRVAPELVQRATARTWTVDPTLHTAMQRAQEAIRRANVGIGIVPVPTRAERMRQPFPDPPPLGRTWGNWPPRPTIRAIEEDEG